MDISKMAKFKFSRAILELTIISAEVQTILTVRIKKLGMRKICLNYSFKSDF